MTGERGGTRRVAGKHPRGTVLVLMLALVGALAGCAGDDPATPQTGDITIDAQPDGIGAPWQITGPAGFARSGADDDTLDLLPAGEYTLTWGAVPGFVGPAPASATLVLAAAGTVTFSGTYTDLYPFTDTPSQLMANFRRAYEAMDIDEYRDTLHESFVFVFVDGSPVAPQNGVYTREEDLVSTTRMFSGEPGQDFDGEPRPGVLGIEIEKFDRLTDWMDVPLDDPDFPGSCLAVFDVRIVLFLDTPSYNMITIDSLQYFHVVSAAAEQRDGRAGLRYYLVGQRDVEIADPAPQFLSNEDMSWGGVKSLY
ncbi:MAG: hypothetical protein IPI34_04270 [bacterium]|nr:hypothetical protein [bacterium]